MSLKKEWKTLDYEESMVEKLVGSLNIRPSICKLLTQRGMLDYQTAKEFFRPTLSHLHDPFLMKDMRKAVDKIRERLRCKDKILVFGDYDVDGTTSVAVMYQFLSNLSENIHYYIPNRYREGYGVSKRGIDHAHEIGASLIVCLDCGIKSVELIRYASTLGISFIVCDHHQPDDTLPDAVAILNPKQPGCPYPYKELSGCGIGFKLMQAIAMELGLEDITFLKYLDLVAISIAADIVPINGENRVLAYFGLEQLNRTPSIGVKALMDIASLKKPIQISHVVFGLAPRINAAGRMDDANKAVELFIESNPERAFTLAKPLQSDNLERKDADLTTTTEALELLAKDPEAQHRKTTVVFQPHWHKGVVGITASRLIEQYYRPTIVLTENDGIVSGSARSVDGFNVYEAIHACSEHLIGYGGHAAAAGMTMLPEKLSAFSEAFEAEVARTIRQESMNPKLMIDAEIDFSDVTAGFVNIIEQMAPFGPENARPIFLAKKTSPLPQCRVLKDLHIKFALSHKGTVLNGVGFNLADKSDLLSETYLDIVFHVEMNEWRGTRSPEIRVLDLRKAV